MIGVQVRDLVRVFLISSVVFFVLKTILSFGLVVNIALAILALHISDAFIKIVWDSLPTSLLPNLRDKAVLVTGCDTGFGNELARRLHALGVTVFAGCLYSEGPGAKRLQDECPERLHVLQLDVTKQDEVVASVQRIEHLLAGKKLWALVNNAGLYLNTEAEYTRIETTRKILDVNSLGVARVTQAFLPMLRRSKGRVVIVASVAGRQACAYTTSYAMSKFAAVAYADALRREMMRWSVSVHTVEPWIYQTDMGNIEVAMKNVIQEWSSAPEHVKADYGGDKYLQQCKEMVTGVMDLGYPASKIYQVVDCMMDAALGQSPKIRYVPGTKGKLITYFSTSLPTCLADLIGYVGMVHGGITDVPNFKDD